MRENSSAERWCMEERSNGGMKAPEQEPVPFEVTKEAWGIGPTLDAS